MYNILSLDDLKNSDKLKDNFFWNRLFFKGIISGEPISDFLSFSKENYNRESKTLDDHGNLYNLLLNDLKSWQDFPLRKNSIIFTNHYDTARAFAIPRPKKGLNFAKLFCVIPKIDSSLAISPNSDLWYSFMSFFSSVGIRKRHYSLIDFNASFRMIATKFDCFDFDKSFENFSDLVEKIKTSKTIVIDFDIETNILYDYIRKNSNNFLDVFNSDFSPSSNNFCLLKANGSLRIDNDREIWTDQDCILIEYGEFEKLVNDLQIDI